MRQLYERMSVHALSAERMDRRVPEGLRKNPRRGYAALPEGPRVVHTAQRAGASSADRGSGHLHSARHRLDQLVSSGLGEGLLALDDDVFHSVALAQHLRDGLQDDVGLFLGVVDQT